MDMVLSLVGMQQEFIAPVQPPHAVLVYHGREGGGRARHPGQVGRAAALAVVPVVAGGRNDPVVPADEAEVDEELLPAAQAGPPVALQAPLAQARCPEAAPAPPRRGRCDSSPGSTNTGTTASSRQPSHCTTSRAETPLAA